MKKIVILILSFVGLLAASQVQAKDLGKAGQTFQIVEEGFIEMIKKKLGEIDIDIDIDKERQKMQELARDKASNPAAVAGLARATETREFYFDPSFEVKEDILLPGGQVLHKAGTKINPLDHMNLDRRMIFIDGRDEQQVGWLRDELIIFKEHDERKAEEVVKDVTFAPTIINRVILTGGRIMDLQKQLDQELYFDQGGELTDKFGIRAVPAIVEQEGKLIRITEIDMEIKTED